MREGGQKVVCVAVCDRGVPTGGGQQPSHAVVAVSGGDALRVRDGVYKRAVGVVRVGDPAALFCEIKYQLYSISKLTFLREYSSMISLYLPVSQ